MVKTGKFLRPNALELIGSVTKNPCAELADSGAVVGERDWVLLR